MKSSEKILVRALKGNKTDRVPFWFMRQAGRYLPEYREMRARQKNFLDFCYSPKEASEVTLQPIRRFDMDGAIIFSDILVIPHALGVDVRFEEGKGPLLQPVRDEIGLDKLAPGNITQKLSPVYEALRLTKKNLPPETALIGFAGAPWTLACYTVEGKSSPTFDSVKSLAKADKKFFSRLIGLFSDAIVEHAGNQIKAGAEIIQIFDSWAGVLDVESYDEWVIAPTQNIIRAIKQNHPEIPIIGFPRQSGERFERYVKTIGVDAVNFDQSVSLEWVKHHLQPHCVVQGCLDPVLLAENKEAMLAQAEHILTSLDKPFVFNLGHGILPHTPIENMQALCEYLKQIHENSRHPVQSRRSG